MRFLLLMIPKGYERAAAAVLPTAEQIAAMMRFNEELTKAGVLRALDGLHPPASSVRVRFANGKPEVQPGPFHETTEAVGGYWILETRTRDEAIEWATRCPAGDGDVIEVRQIQSLEDFEPGSVPEVSAALKAIGGG